MTYDEVKEICERYGIKNWSLNEETGLVDVDEHVVLSGKNLTELPLCFGNVAGDFFCNKNKLTMLKGAPISVNRNFDCSENNIQTKHKLPYVGHLWCDKTTKWTF